MESPSRTLSDYPEGLVWWDGLRSPRSRVRLGKQVPRWGSGCRMFIRVCPWDGSG